MDLIVIPSLGRHTQQQTLACFNKTGISESYRVIVCVPEREAQKYKRMSYTGRRVKGEVHAVPSKYDGIARTREYILTKMRFNKNLFDKPPRYILMVDDDLRFCMRGKLQESYMRYITQDPYQMHRMVETMYGWMKNKGFVHCGLIPRQANRNVGVKWLQPSRQINIHGFDATTIRRIGIEYGRVPVMEDFDITLQLLRKGYPNRISCRYAWTQTSNSDGGCSTYRTADVQAAAARKLAKLHKGYVKLTTRKAKTWKNKLNVERVDVVVAWKKALTDARAAIEEAHLKGVGDG